MKIDTIVTRIYGENCFLVSDGEGGCVVIDPGAGGEQVTTLAKEKGLILKGILLTHGHVDHVYDVRRLREEWKVPVVMCREDVDFVQGRQLSGGFINLPQENFFTPDLMPEDGAKICLGAWNCTVLKTPGHSSGSCCYLTEDCLFTGDTLFKGSMGRTDLPGSDPDAMMESLVRIRDLPGEYTVYPGHGAATSLEWERATNLFLNGDAAARGWM